MLIDKLIRNLPRIERLIDEGKVKRDDFNFLHLTSEIP